MPISEDQWLRLSFVAEGRTKHTFVVSQSYPQKQIPVQLNLFQHRKPCPVGMVIVESASRDFIKQIPRLRSE